LKKALEALPPRFLNIPVRHSYLMFEREYFLFDENRENE
jgi:hypothetical protein